MNSIPPTIHGNVAYRIGFAPGANDQPQRTFVSAAGHSYVPELTQALYPFECGKVPLIY
jgi:hypothetical protein